MTQVVRIFVAAMMIASTAHAKEVATHEKGVTPLIRTSQTVGGKNIELENTSEVLIASYVLNPGQRLPAHKHPYQRLVYIISGSINHIEVDKDKTTLYETGSFIPEETNEWHSAMTGTNEPAHLLVIDFVPKGTLTNTIMKDTHITPPKREVTRISTTMSGQPLVLPEAAEIRSLLYVTGSNTNFPVHQHIYPRMLYILDGEMDIIDSESHEIRKLRQGDFLIEAIRRWHWGENNGKSQVRMLVLDVVPKDSANNVILKTEIK